MKTFCVKPGKSAAALVGLLLLAGAAGAGETASGVGPTERDARLYCEDAADRLDILAEDREDFMRQCIADYLESPPGDIGVDPEPGSSGY